MISNPTSITLLKYPSTKFWITKKLIDHSINQLLAAKSFLQQKSDKLKLSLTAEHGKIEEIQLPAQRILHSSPITGNYDDHDF